MMTEEEKRRWEKEFARRTLESDRDFERSVFQDNRNFGFNRDQDARRTLESDRNFGYTKERDKATDARELRDFEFAKSKDSRDFDFTKSRDEREFNLRKAMQDREMDLADEDRITGLQSQLVELQAANNANASFLMDREGRMIRQGDGVDRTNLINTVTGNLAKLQKKKAQKDEALRNAMRNPYGGWAG